MSAPQDRLSIDLLRPLKGGGPLWYLLVAALAAIVGVGLLAWTAQMWSGFGLTGIRWPVYWGFLITDLPSGGYTSWVDPNNPGPRPARFGGPYNPAFLMTGETPQSGTYREEFARMLTGNRQFARAAVNYIWAAMFTQGIVDPPGQWDLARLDPANPPPNPWTLQPTHPELIEALATGGYDGSSLAFVSSSAALFSPSVKRQYLQLLPNVMVTDAGQVHAAAGPGGGG